MIVTAANRRALARAAARARAERPRHLARIADVLARAGVRAESSDLVRAAGTAAVTVNFHPDRLLSDGRSVAEALAREGVYRSQFETGISNGGLTAYPGGDRDRWEATLFGGTYQAPDVTAGERPRYGGLNLMDHANGACPFFGSCHLRLRAAAARQATVIFGDSNALPADVGVIDALEPVLAPLLESAAATGSVLGCDGVDIAAFVSSVLAGSLRGGMSHSVSDYLEAQIHGAVDLAADVEELVIDPAFAGTAVGEQLRLAGERYGFVTRSHAGAVLAVTAVPDDVPVAGGERWLWRTFCADGRARRMAERVAGWVDAPQLDAMAIGSAAACVVRDPERWRDWGTAEQVRQELKYLWAIVVAYGEPPQCVPTL